MFNPYIRKFEKDKTERKFEITLLENDYFDKLRMCNHKVYFLMGFLTEYKLRNHLGVYNLRFTVFDVECHHMVIYDVWAPSGFRNLVSQCFDFDLGQGNLWTLYHDNQKTEDVLE